MKHKDTWNGTYKGVSFEITQWGVGVQGAYRPQGTWNYYIFVTDQQLSPADFSKVWLEPESYHEFKTSGRRTPYYGYNDIWHDIEFHGGVTFYEKHSEVDVDRRWVKTGCDYAHLWDSDRDYSVGEVEMDVHHSINILVSKLRFKLRCSWNSKYIFEENGEWHGKEDGIFEDQFYSKPGWQAMLDMRAEHAAERATGTTADNS